VRDPRASLARECERLRCCVGSFKDSVQLASFFVCAFRTFGAYNSISTQLRDSSLSGIRSRHVDSNTKLDCINTEFSCQVLPVVLANEASKNTCKDKVQVVQKFKLHTALHRYRLWRASCSPSGDKTRAGTGSNSAGCLSLYSVSVGQVAMGGEAADTRKKMRRGGRAAVQNTEPNVNPRSYRDTKHEAFDSARARLLRMLNTKSATRSRTGTHSPSEGWGAPDGSVGYARLTPEWGS